MTKSRNPEPTRDAPKGVIIRAVEPEDAAAVTALANLPGFRWGTMRLPYESVDATRERLWTSGADRVGLVAVRDDIVVGMASLRRHQGRRAHAGSIGMGVHDAHVGTGIGTALLSALIGVADDWWGLQRIELTVNADNDRAIHLYEASGFEREGVLRDYALRGGQFVDALSMARLRRT